ncbi:hypothetical protein QNI23_017315 (plasmid) [Bermanella sp. WJH001]|uniref:hypothetical protein n=1 Tax=Bermanella sp. WJH001 TaxID=3048005 RepID=UPI0024BDD21E|nr:hypothetical protein [Bermanella sp. WJH001]MDJ1539511.1 hypothetical protein [Bermanella sp. WJH001]
MTPSIDPHANKNNNRHNHGMPDWQAIASVKSTSQQCANILQSSILFLRRFICHESLYGDSEGAKELLKVQGLLGSLESFNDEAFNQQLRDSYEYVCCYLELLQETQAPLDLCLEFERLIHILEAIQCMQQQSALGVVGSLAQLKSHLKPHN